MEKIVRVSLLNIDLEDVPADKNESLEAYGMDSLMSALLFSELEKQLQCDLDVKQFKQEDFYSISSIIKFIERSRV